MQKRANRVQGRIGTVCGPSLPMASFRDDSPEQAGLDHTPCSTVETPPLRSLRDQLQLRLQTRTRSLIASISGLKFDGVKEILEEMIEYLLDLIDLQELD